MKNFKGIHHGLKPMFHYNGIEIKIMKAFNQSTEFSMKGQSVQPEQKYFIIHIEKLHYASVCCFKSHEIKLVIS